MMTVLKNVITKKRAIVSIVCILTWMFVLMISSVHYTTCDDTHLNLIAAGAYGPESQYLIHINILLEHLNLPGSVSVAIIIVMLFSYDLIEDIQYTKNAAWYGIIGGLLFLYNSLRDKRARSLDAAVVIFVALSFMVRPHSAALTLPFLGIAVLVVFLKDKKRNMLPAIAVVMIAVITVLAINHIAYTRQQDWRDYVTWNRISTQMRDFGRYSFEDNKEKLLEAGITETDYLLLSNNIFADPEGLSVDKMKQIESVGKANESFVEFFSINTFLHSLDFVHETLRTRPLASICAVIMLLIVLGGSGREILTALLFVLVMLMEYHYFTHLNRVMWRAEFATWITPCTLLFMLLLNKLNVDRLKKSEEAGDDNVTKRLRIVMPAVVIALLLMSSLYKVTNNNNSEEAPNTTVTDIINEDSEHFYLAGFGHYWNGLCGADDIFSIDRNMAGYYHNICLLGTWQIPSPIGLYYARTHGIENPIRQLVDDDVYFIGTGEEVGWLMEYLNEKNELEVFVAQVETIEDVAVWDFFEGVWIDGKMQRVSP